MKTPIVLRDLNSDDRAKEELKIRLSGTAELKKALEEDRDIVIGEYYPFSKYRVY